MLSHAIEMFRKSAGFIVWPDWVWQRVRTLTPTAMIIVNELLRDPYAVVDERWGKKTFADRNKSFPRPKTWKRALSQLHEVGLLIDNKPTPEWLDAWEYGWKKSYREARATK